MKEYRAANKLFVYTILLILFISVTGLTTLSDSYLFSLCISQLCMVLPAVLYLFLMRDGGRKNEGRNDGRLKVGGMKTDSRKSVTGADGTTWSSAEGVIRKRLGLNSVKPLPLLAAVIMGFAIIPFISMINSISMLFVKNITDSKVTAAAENHSVWFMLLMVAAVPALVEELLYRGIYFGVYRRAGVIQGALLAALLFALMHGNLNQFAYAIVAGFLFAMIDSAGGSVIYSVIMHIIINGVSVLSLYAEQMHSELINRLSEETVYTSVFQVVKDLGIPAMLGLVITALGYMIIRKFSDLPEDIAAQENEGKTACRAAGKRKKERIADVYLVVGIVIMAVNLVANEML